jgi:hypothetical protein
MSSGFVFILAVMLFLVKWKLNDLGFPPKYLVFKSKYGLRSWDMLLMNLSMNHFFL